MSRSLRISGRGRSKVRRGRSLRSRKKMGGTSSSETYTTRRSKILKKRSLGSKRIPTKKKSSLKKGKRIMKKKNRVPKRRNPIPEIPIDTFWIIIRFLTIHDVFSRLILVEKRLYKFTKQESFLQMMKEMYVCEKFGCLPINLFQEFFPDEKESIEILFISGLCDYKNQPFLISKNIQVRQFGHRMYHRFVKNIEKNTAFQHEVFYGKGNRTFFSIKGTTGNEIIEHKQEGCNSSSSSSSSSSITVVENMEKNIEQEFTFKVFHPPNNNSEKDEKNQTETGLWIHYVYEYKYIESKCRTGVFQLREEGVMKTYFENGELESVQEFGIDGKLKIRFLEFYPDSSLKVRAGVQNGILYGGIEFVFLEKEVGDDYRHTMRAEYDRHGMGVREKVDYLDFPDSNYPGYNIYHRPEVHTPSPQFPKYTFHFREKNGRLKEISSFLNYRTAHKIKWRDRKERRHYLSDPDVKNVYDRIYCVLKDLEKSIQV